MSRWPEAAIALTLASAIHLVGLIELAPYLNNSAMRDAKDETRVLPASQAADLLSAWSTPPATLSAPRFSTPATGTSPGLVGRLGDNTPRQLTPDTMNLSSVIPELPDRPTPLARPDIVDRALSTLTAPVEVENTDHVSHSDAPFLAPAPDALAALDAESRPTVAPPNRVVVPDAGQVSALGASPLVALGPTVTTPTPSQAPRVWLSRPEPPGLSSSNRLVSATRNLAPSKSLRPKSRPAISRDEGLESGNGNVNLAVDKAAWGAQIQSQLQSVLQYPSGATGEASVLLSIVVSPTGELLSVQIARSSGNEVFDAAAIAALIPKRQYAAAPETLAGGNHRFNLPLVFVP